MLKESISILHTGDIQIEVRNHNQRFDEFQFILHQIEQIARFKNPKVYLVAGDVFEFCKPNDIERLIFIEHLTRMCSIESIEEIIITYGNHDVDQRKSTNFFKHKGIDTPAANSLDSIVAAVKNSKIMLLSHSAIYHSNHIPGLSYINWSQKTKHSNILEEHYNPMENDISNHNPYDTMLTIYHDTIQGCKQWDGNELKAAQKSSGMDVFTTPTILAGDIHIPQIIKYDEKQFVYCGSPVPRNFGEGDYYENGKLTQRNCNRHAVHYCTIEADGKMSSTEFLTIPQYRCYNTFVITSKNVPDDWDDLNWIVANKGTYETCLRIKLPSATDTFLKAEPAILDAIAKQNAGYLFTSINFSYGKTIDSEDDLNPLLQTTSDIEKLISDEKIIEVAYDYIQRMIQKSASIVPDDKEACIKFIKEVFINEMKNFSNDIPTNRISFESINIDNFMSFGDNIHVNFLNTSGLIKLLGGNGIGKTTFYNAIKWIITGFISREQNRVKKNENNLLIFNDYRWNVDNVYGCIKTRINGNLVIIERKIYREWKKNVTDEQKQQKNWKTFIANTSSEINITNQSETYTADVAEKWLDDVFGGLENLERIVFPNQFTLRSFVCSDSARLCEEVLNHIGMNFFDKMYERYDEIRKEHLNNVAKPAQTIESLKSLIAECDIKIQKAFEDYDNISSDIGAVDMNIYSSEEQIKDKKSKQYPDITKELIEAEGNEITIAKTEIDTKLEKTKIGIETFNKRIEVNPLILIETSIANDEIDITNKQKDLATANKNVQIANQVVSDNTQKIQLLGNEINIKFNNDIADANLQKSKLETGLITMKSELKDSETKQDSILKNYISGVNTSIYEKQSHLTEHKHIVDKNNEKIKSLQNEIDSLSNSTTCPTCKRELEKLQLDIIDTNIKHKQTEIEAFKTLNEKSNVEITEMNDSIELLNKEILNVTENPMSLQELSNEYYNVACSIKNSITKYEQDIQDIDQKIQLLRNQSKDAVANNQQIKDMLANHKVLKIGVDNANANVDKITIELNTANETLKSHQQDLADHNALLINIEKIKTLQSSLIAEQTVISNREYVNNENKSKLLQNENIQLEIDELESELIKEKKELFKLNSKLEEAKFTCETEKQIKKAYEDNIQNAIAYRIVESSMKQYKTLLGKQGLPQHIFTMISGVINNKLNDLLTDMDFRLRFNEANMLQMIDLSKPGNPVRTPMQMSGMQTVFTGLALIYVNRLCNNTFIFDGLFIDEVSGQLNTGFELTYESQNYQDQLKKLLKRFVNMKVWIIDHVIDDLGEDYIFEVVPTNDGAKIITK